MFRTDLLSIIKSLNTVFTAIGIYHTSYTDWLLADSQHNLYKKYQLLWIQYQDSWWWTISLSERCRDVYQNKVKKINLHWQKMETNWTRVICFSFISMLNLKSSTLCSSKQQCHIFFFNFLSTFWHKTCKRTSKDDCSIFIP